MTSRIRNALFFRVGPLLLLTAAGVGTVFAASGWATPVKAAVAGGIVLLALVVAYLLVGPFGAGAAAISRTAIRLAEGDVNARVPNVELPEFEDAATAVNQLAVMLRRSLSDIASEQERASEILTVMADGVLVLDARGRILRANPSASSLLGANLKDQVGKRFVDLVRSFPAKDLGDEALTQGVASRHRLLLPGGRYVSVQVIPLHQPALSGGEKQVLFIIQDETVQVLTARMRRDFAANVSHELKTPLASLQLLADTLQHAVREDPEAAVGFAKRLSAEMTRLSDLVNDLLTLSRLEQSESGTGEECRRLDLGELADEVAADFSDRAAEKELHLTVEAHQPVHVVGDVVQLATLIRNLLDNAVRFTDPGGSIQVSVTGSEDQALLSVRDTGIGIPKDEQARVFERFYRVDKARSRATGGTGLGLSIVKHIAEQHSGRVLLDSTVGLGSTFTVRLPASPEANEPSPDSADPT